MKLSSSFICSGEAKNEYKAHVCAPLFFREFTLSKIDGAKLGVCGLGFYRLFVNGVELTKGRFAPYISNPDEVLYYDCYDASVYLKEGRNVLAVWLGNGMQNSIGGDVWDFDKGSWRSAPKLALCFENGGQVVFESDEQFVFCPSAITFDDMRAGEHYDARKETSFSPESLAGMKSAVLTDAPKGEKRICRADPIVVREERKPISIVECENGYVYDFGIDSAGIVKLCVNADEGQKIKLYHFELFSNGKINRTNIAFAKTKADYWQQNEYVCKRGYNEYIPSFAWVGCRYVYVEGLTKEQATKASLTFLLASSDLKRSVFVKTSNRLLNKFYENVINSDYSNFYYFPMDCPHREKNGWTGDAKLSAEQYCLNFDCRKSFDEWLFNVRRAQRENGSIPLIVPTGDWGFGEVGPAWDGVLVELPYRMYQYYRDEQILKDNISAILKYLAFAEGKRDERGLVDFGMGDREQTYSDESSDFDTPTVVTNTLIFIELCQKTEKMLAVLGEEKERVRICALKNGLIGAFKKHCINEYCKVVPFTQTGQALAIDVGIFEGEEKDYAVAQLVWLVQSCGLKTRAGAIGVRVLFNVLSENGYPELAYKMAMSEEYPGFLYPVKQGATSLWESPICLSETANCLERKIGIRLPSFNHHWFGSVSAWFVKYVIGFKLSEDLSDAEVTLVPAFVDELKYATARISCRGTEFSIGWKHIGRKKVKLTVKTDNQNVKWRLSGKYRVLKERESASGEKTYILLKEQEKTPFHAFPYRWQYRKQK